MVLMMLMIYLIDAQFSTVSNCFHRTESPNGLEVYLHALQLLTTVDEGIQTLGKSDRHYVLSAAIGTSFQKLKMVTIVLNSVHFNRRWK